MPARNYGQYARRAGAVMGYVADHRGNVPILRFALGLVLVGFFALGIMLQIQTSEAFILNSSAQTLAPNWHILTQPWDLLRGALPTNEAKAAMWGWGIELVYLVCVVGEVAVNRFQKWFRTGAFGLVAFNFWTDYNYGALPSGLGGQIAFAAITSFVVAFFGVIGINLIWSAITDR